MTAGEKVNHAIACGGSSFGNRKKLTRHFALVLLSTCSVFGQAPKAQKSHVQASSIWSQEPDGFKGLQFGSSQADAGSKIYSHSCLSLDTDTAFCQVSESDIGSVGTSSHFIFQDNKFVSADGEFDSAEFETIRDIFVQRYGQPHNHQRQVVRNNAGGIFQNETITWVGKKVTIFLTKYGTTVTHGVFDVSLNSYTAEKERRDNEKKKKAANAL